MDHLCKRRSRGRLLHRTPEGTLLKRGGGGNATPGTLSRKNYVHRFRKRTLAKSQLLLFVERHRRSQPHPRPHVPTAPSPETPDSRRERREGPMATASTARGPGRLTFATGGVLLGETRPLPRGAEGRWQRSLVAVTPATSGRESQPPARNICNIQPALKNDASMAHNANLALE